MKHETKLDRVQRKSRRKWWVGLVAVGLVTTGTVVGLQYITFAEGDTPRNADAVYLLGPVTPERLDVGLELIESGYSNDLVVTVSGNEELQKTCQQDHEHLHCVKPDPVTTSGEAQSFSELAEQHEWKSVMIVTLRSHLTRAELSFGQCFTGEISMIDEGRSLTVRQEIYRFMYESAALVQYAFTRAC